MKRIISVLFVFAMIMALASCQGTNVVNSTDKNGELNTDTYVPDGTLTAFNSRVDMNQEFYNSIFVLGHLKIDEKTTVEKNGKKWAKVTDKTYTTYEELKAAVYDVYTEETAKKILSDYPIYADINGVLYYDTSYKVQDGVKWKRNTEENIEMEGREEGKYTLEYRFYDGRGDELQEFTFVRVDTGINPTWKLNEFVKVD